MKQDIINHELHITIPEGFHLLSEDELNQIYMDENAERWGMRNEEDHMIFVIYYHRSNPLLAALASENDIVKSTQLKLAKGMENHGYAFNGYFSKEACGQERPGFDYEYNVGAVRQSGRILIIKKKNVCYTVYFYTRDNLLDKNLVHFDEVINSLSFE